MAKILLIEDDESYAEILADVLSTDNEVETVYCGLDALALLRMNNFDLIVTDWGLPDMTGLDLCKQFRQAGGKTSILMLTGRGNIDDKEAAFEAGIDDYLTKPCDLKELRMRAKALVRRGADNVAIKGIPNDGTHFGSANLIGQVLAEKYEVVSLIGQGATGTVYRARHRLLDKDVAIKMLHPHLVADPNSSVRFWQEAKALSSLTHPFIVTVRDFGLSPTGQLYTIADYLEGSSLQLMLLTLHKLPVDRAVRLFVLLSEALVYVHKQGIVHRDIKPANIMIVEDASGQEIPKLVDFGLIKSVAQEGVDPQSITQFGELVGSPLYMSPEQCIGQQVDQRSDIFALGCVMYETLTGIIPLKGANAVETMNLRVFESPKTFAQIRPELGLPSALEKIVFKALAKHPIDRYQSAQALADDLKAFQVSWLEHSGYRS